MSVAEMKTITVMASLLFFCNIFTSCRAESEFCFASVCEFAFVVSESRSMIYTTQDGSNSYDVKLEEGTLKLVTNRRHTQVPNITLTPDMVHTADGNGQRSIILINDQFPGPTLEVMEGAEVAVKVVNELLKEGITIHWHGIHLHNNVWMDGVPYVTQCPILPRQSFTYRFIASPPGTHWYHSHNELQRLDGLFGALIVRRLKEKGMLVPPHFPMVINDWFPLSSTEVDLASPYRNMRRGTAESLFLSIENKGNSFDGVEVASADYWSGLINGRGRKGNNTSPLTVFNVTQGKMYRFHIVMASGEFAYQVSIDMHELTVIESDGSPVEPVTFESVIIFPGETYVVEFEANQNPGRYWIRATTLRIGKGFENPQPDGIVWDVKAILNYEGASDKEGDPKSRRRNCTSETPCKVLNCPWPAYRQDLFPNMQCVAFSELRLDSSRYESNISPKKEEVDLELFLNMAFPIGSSINSLRMVMPRAPLFQEPSTWQLVPCTQECTRSGCRCSNIVNLPANKTVQLVLMADIFGGFQEGTVPGSESKAHHPMHLHGYRFRVLKTAYPIVDNITGKILDGNKDIVCNWREDRTCSHPYWSSERATGLNMDNPPLKDTVLVPAMGYTVVRFRTDNPGYWLFHCHSILHLVEGMALVFNVSYKDQPPIPSGFPTCQSFYIGHEEFKKYLTKSKKGKDCGEKSTADEKPEEKSTDKVTLVEALSAVAASCSSIGVLFQIILLVLFFKFYYRSRDHSGLTKDKNVAMVKLST